MEVLLHVKLGSAQCDCPEMTRCGCDVQRVVDVADVGCWSLVLLCRRVPVVEMEGVEVCAFGDNHTSVMGRWERRLWQLSFPNPHGPQIQGPLFESRYNDLRGFANFLERSDSNGVMPHPSQALVDAMQSLEVQP